MRTLLCSAVALFLLGVSAVRSLADESPVAGAPPVAAAISTEKMQQVFDKMVAHGVFFCSTLLVLVQMAGASDGKDGSAGPRSSTDPPPAGLTPMERIQVFANRGKVRQRLADVELIRGARRWLMITDVLDGPPESPVGAVGQTKQGALRAVPFWAVAPSARGKGLGSRESPAKARSG
jgi:hypothetical protein